MYYYWIPIALLFLVAILSDTNAWSPFQSDQVKEICQHMTKAERRGALTCKVQQGRFFQSRTDRQHNT